MIYQPSGLADALAIVDNHSGYSADVLRAAIPLVEAAVKDRLSDEKFVAHVKDGLLEIKWGDWSRYGGPPFYRSNPGAMATEAIWHICDAIEERGYSVLYARSTDRGTRAALGFCASVGVSVKPL